MIDMAGNQRLIAALQWSYRQASNTNCENILAPCKIVNDHYTLLGFLQSVVLEMIRTSYRGMAVALHPNL